MPEAKTSGLAAVLFTLAIAGGVWLLLRSDTSSEPATPRVSARVGETLAPIPPEHMPPPFEERMIRKPDPMEPAPSQTAAFCSDENWGRLNALVSQGEGGEFRVDAALWNRSLGSSRAGIASWMSYCKSDGQAVRIVAADSGALLATYDPESGLRSPDG
jgi:hypothetical protein